MFIKAVVDKGWLNDVPALENALGGMFLQAEILPGGKAGVILAITNTGGIRVDEEIHPDGIFKAGDFTASMASEIFPFGNTLVIVETTGTQFKEAFDHAASASLDPVGFFAAVSRGAIYEVDTSEQTEILDANEESPDIETPDERIVVVRLSNWTDVVPDKVALDLELPTGLETIQVEIDTDSIEELKTVHCPVCTAVDPFSIGDYEYQCQACGAEFVVLRGPG